MQVMKGQTQGTVYPLLREKVAPVIFMKRAANSLENEGVSPEKR